MSDAPESAADKINNTLKAAVKDLAGGWAAYSALGSFALYVVGYLVLRFHLTALGVGTDLGVLDERYLFTGAKFLVYLGSTVPIVVLMAMPVAAFGWILAKFRLARTFWGKIRNWFAQPARLALFGIVISTALIQLLMRQCFLLNNLLLADCLPKANGLREVLLDRTGGRQALYFSLLLTGLFVTAGLLYGARRGRKQTSLARFLTALLAVLVALQFLLVPVNYGVLIVDKTLPKVTDLGGVETLQAGQEAWLVWEGKEGVTWLVVGSDANGVSRKLVTLPQKEVKKTQIIQYDALAHCLTDVSCEAMQTE
jgi:hypothetical protein